MAHVGPEARSERLPRFLAFDLGAESGRAVVGTIAGGRLFLEEIHRFANEPVEVCDTLHWDILALLGNLLKGMREYVRRFGPAVEGVGLDTWGVDFGLLARDGTLLQNPVHYRDRRTEGMPEVILARMSAQELFEATGMGCSPIHTLCQLLALRRAASPILQCANSLLMIPDLLAYFLTGHRACERTVAASSQLYSPHAHRWNDAIFRVFDLPCALMPPLVWPATTVGGLRPAVQRDTGLREAVLIAPCTHDTASAVAAVPGDGDNWAFISSGTWSVLGALNADPITTPEALAAGACNELTLDSFFLCRNIMGLWLLQQARASFARRGATHSYAEMVALAEAAPCPSLIDPDDPAFLAPEDMCDAIAAFCRRTGQRPPEGPGETARCILESLALCYRQALNRLAAVLGRRFRVLHVVGGGARNGLLCQLTASATGLPVVAGPVEATVAGNVLVQALARGVLSSPDEIRRVVRRSSELTEYTPREAARWDDRYAAYRGVLARAEHGW